MEITNVELMLLQIIREQETVSGYEINQLIKERGYREWGDIGTTSIYVGLKKLSKKQLVNSYLDTTKQGKGPMPRKFEVTDDGVKLLKQNTLESLSSSRERDNRFDLALAGIPFLTTEEVLAALQKRKEFLSEVAININKKFDSQGGKRLPFHVQALFKHPHLLIKNEIEFMDTLIKDLLLEKSDDKEKR
ncbi:PadR family transcriptional regulator [Ureibacillus sinduriensis]|uniref:PadR family transcriptional regulator n=1 Tax=Ureibacillus sinduriensis BLB-1 = JCM 15800 TaxID=1384057 RepID=A0A0A3IMN1_9BACL|nr:PadR family transcriptional regulator [Ureibacillus sinduriensis]KGR76097.1 PadR family transcriptional regulator [Ureibacillus sinduriensis BLB-1 = JCM 15800]